MNVEKYPWLKSLKSLGSGSGGGAVSAEAAAQIQVAREKYLSTGAVTFPNFIDPAVLTRIVDVEISGKEKGAFTTDDFHTPHQLQVDPKFHPPNSVRNYLMRTQVASVAYDELPENSALAALYKHPALLALVSAVTGHSDGLFLSEDPLGCCSINVFRPKYAHSFHFDESEFSTTIMLREAEVPGTGLFQYTPPLRRNDKDLALDAVASVIRKYCKSDPNVDLTFAEEAGGVNSSCPHLHTMDLKPGTLSIFSGSKSLHRVTEVKGTVSRLTAILTYASKPGFKNSEEVQRMFWGRSSEQ